MAGFQSTLPHGERLTYLSSYAMSLLFQSTLPHGERPGEPLANGQGLFISIHAPARGATYDFP